VDEMGMASSTYVIYEQSVQKFWLENLKKKNLGEDEKIIF